MTRYKFNKYLVLILAVTSSFEVVTSKNSGRLFFRSLPFESLTVFPFLHGFCTLQSIAQVITDKELSNLIQIIAASRNLNAFDFINQLQINLRHLNGLSQTLKISPRDIPDYVIKPTQSERPTGKSQKIQPPSGRNLGPPPDATIYIFRENLKDPITPPISFSVPPSMSTMDALHLVSRHFAESASLTPLRVRVKMSTSRQCHVVDKIGNYSQNGGFYWQVMIVDKDNKILARGACIPGPEEVLVLPGTRIYLVHTSVE